MVATVRVALQHRNSTPVYVIAGAIVALLLLLAWRGDVAAERRRTDREQEAAAAGTTPGTPGPGGLGEPGGTGAGFPVPPLDLPHYHGVGVVVPSGGSRPGEGDTAAGPVKEVTGA
jgi:NADH-quinone oxidoreductase subunit H